MTEAEVKAGLNDRLALALTAWAEARGDKAEGGSSVEERLAVMSVIRNRAADTRHRWRKTITGVCLAPLQFSCWNEGHDRNHLVLMDMAAGILDGKTITDRLLIETLYLADGILGGQIMDATGGANHYYAPKAMRPVGAVPEWSIGKVGRAIGDQVFFTL